MPSQQPSPAHPAAACWTSTLEPPLTAPSTPLWALLRQWWRGRWTPPARPSALLTWENIQVCLSPAAHLRELLPNIKALTCFLSRWTSSDRGHGRLSLHPRPERQHGQLRAVCQRVRTETGRDAACARWGSLKKTASALLQSNMQENKNEKQNKIIKLNANVKFKKNSQFLLFIRKTKKKQKTAIPG